MRIKFETETIDLKLFSIINILSLISCFINIGLGILSSVIILLLVIWNTYKRKYIFDPVFCIYLFSSLISMVAYMWNDRPLIIYVQALSFNFIPSLLYFIGRNIAEDSKAKQWALHTLNAFCFMMAIGTIAYLAFPGFYYQYLGQSIESFAYGLGDYRYGSFISSLALGSVSSISIVVYFYIFEELKKWQRISYLPLIILNVVMCMQRSAWIVAVIALFCSVFYKFKSNRKLRIRIIGFLFGLIIIISLIWLGRASIFTSAQLEYFENRLEVVNIASMFGSRNSQWEAAWKVFLKNPLTGLGLGSCGQKAAPYGLAVVTDGNHLRILAEIGIIGFLMFCYINIRAIWRSYKRKQFYFSLAIILYNMAAIGSPIFDQYYASFAYWIILGCASGTAPLRGENTIGYFNEKRIIRKEN